MYLELPASKNMPHVLFKDGVLMIKGTSIPQLSSPFFEPLLRILNDYSLSPENQTTVELHLDFLNSDSMRSLMNVLIIIEKIFINGNKVSVNWYYHSEEDTIYDSGAIFQSLLELPIKLIKL